MKDESEARCLNCLDTGIIRCTNPDHGIIGALSLGRLGCPLCDGTGKMPVDEECDCGRKGIKKWLNDNRDDRSGSNDRLIFTPDELEDLFVDCYMEITDEQ